MISTTITLHGFVLPVYFDFNDKEQITWYLDNDISDLPNSISKVLEFLIRKHYSFDIEKQLFDEAQARIYEADAKAAATAEDMPF